MSRTWPFFSTRPQPQDGVLALFVPMAIIVLLANVCTYRVEKLVMFCGFRGFRLDLPAMFMWNHDCFLVSNRPPFMGMQFVNCVTVLRSGSSCQQQKPYESDCKKLSWLNDKCAMYFAIVHSSFLGLHWKFYDGGRSQAQNLVMPREQYG